MFFYFVALNFVAASKFLHIVAIYKDSGLLQPCAILTILSKTNYIDK